VRRLRPLSEAECYARCYGAGDDAVRFMKREPRQARQQIRVSGESLRQAFEQRLEAREVPADDQAPPATVDGHEPAAAA
jgi:hypothetical protein